ncbi:MAG: hypothetical protein P8J87_11955, partial [Verrucomicrobiales bacterium]|nr:hypothetical protein [Verrucomicrobiales bacterium]
NDVRLYYSTDGTEPQGSIGDPGKNTTTATFRHAFDSQAGESWWRANITGLPPGSPFRYKIGAHRKNAPVRFPFSARDVELKRNMQTVFAITGFDAAAVGHFPHNDHGSRATGLAEGFHILRTRAFLGRAANETSIFHTGAQTFYVDAHPPAGQFAFPRPGETIGPDNYAAVVLADATTTTVEFRILHSSTTNGQPWQPASRIGNPTQLGTSGLAQEWRFDYANIPASGTANIEVRLSELTGNSQVIRQHIITNTAPLDVPGLAITHNPDNTITLTFPTIPTQSYTLQSSPDLNSFNNTTATFTPTTPTTHSITLPTPTSPTYFRLHLSTR